MTTSTNKTAYLIFTGGYYPEISSLCILFDTILTKMNYIPFVLAADSGLEMVERLGIEPDLILGDMDSLEDPTSILSKYSEDKVIKYPVYKDYTDTELALMNVYDKKTKDDLVVLVGGDGGRLDHLMGIISLFDFDYHPDIWCACDQILYQISDNHFNGIEISSLNNSEPVSIFAHRKNKITDFKDYKIISEGLEWPLDNLDWQHGEKSLSNRKSSNYSGNVKIKVQKGSFFVITPYSSMFNFL